MLGAPVPDATQWDLVESVADDVYPVFNALIQQKDFFPQECEHVIHALCVMYREEDFVKAHKLTDQERLAHHQQHTKPVLDELRQWLETQFEARLVEPNASLGKAYRYLLNHWDQLTCFLRVPGAPLDNNIAEHLLKLMILLRKNSLFAEIHRLHSHKHTVCWT